MHSQLPLGFKGLPTQRAPRALELAQPLSPLEVRMVSRIFNVEIPSEEGSFQNIGIEDLKKMIQLILGPSTLQQCHP